MPRRLFAALAAGLALSLAPALAADVTTTATGQRKADLEKMELKDFPAAAWGELSAWANGEALTAAGLSGKPVLIVTWSSWHPASLKALAIAQRMHETHGPQGLIVVGVHGPQGWDKAAEAASARKATFLLAHDAGGGFRKAIKVATDPDWYVIDRAGHLRYAAVSSSSVDEACEEVTGESKAEANNLPKLLKERADREAVRKGRTTGLRENLDLSSLPPVPPGFTPPTEENYQKLAWPIVDKEIGEKYGLIEQNTGKPREPKLNFTTEGYYPSKPQFEGRAIVIYVWHPDMYDSYNGAFDRMDALQQQYPRDLAVIGAMTPIAKLDPSRANAGQFGQQVEDPERLVRRYEAFVRSRAFRHSLAADLSGSALGSLAGQNMSSEKPPLPFAIIASSDGTIRWVGRISGPDFKYAIDQVLAVDPGVLARRAADRAYIQRQGR
jgi:hypothetical protein